MAGNTMEGFSVNPDQFDSAGSGFQANSTDLQDVWQSFMDKVSSASDAAGSDEIGGIIGEIHQVIVDAFDESITACVDELVAAGEDVKEWAASHLESDEETAQIFEDLLGELGSGAGR